MAEENMPENKNALFLPITDYYKSLLTPQSIYSEDGATGGF
jgi:hypothetical protein